MPEKKKMFLLLFCLSAAGLLALLIACGGGGGSDSTTATTSTGTSTTTPVDRTGSVSGTFIDSFATAVNAGDLQQVQAKFTDKSWNQVYKSYFESSDTDLAKLAEEIRSAVLDQEEDDYAVYKITRTENGVVKTYFVQLIKSNGEWKVLSL